jgi:hypothetical protein
MSQESKKQTAVDWLIHELKSLGIYSLTLKEKCEQAKEMEKQQIMDACDYGIKLYINDPITSEDYYNETYGGNK